MWARLHAAALVLPLVLPLVVACPPTLSRPRSPEFERELAEGERDTVHGRDGDAAAHFAAAAERADRRVDRDEARYRQARALIDADRFAEAVAILDAIATAEPPSRRTARAIFDAARLRATQLDEPARAKAQFRQVVLEHPDSGLASRAFHWLAKGVESEALVALCDELDALVGTTSLGDDLLMRRHDALVALGRIAEARRSLERLVERHPYPHGERWDDAILLLADMDVAEGNAPAAIERLERMLERSETTQLSGSYTLPSFPIAHLRIARLHLQGGRISDADDWFGSLSDAFPHSTLRDDALVERGLMWMDVGDDRPRGCSLLRAALEEFEVGHARRLASARVQSSCSAAD